MFEVSILIEEDASPHPPNVSLYFLMAVCFSFIHIFFFFLLFVLYFHKVIASFLQFLILFSPPFYPSLCLCSL